MPGSRVKEVRMNLPTILEASDKLGSGYEFLLPVAPTLDRSFLQKLLGARKITLVGDALPASGIHGLALLPVERRPSRRR